MSLGVGFEVSKAQTIPSYHSYVCSPLPLPLSLSLPWRMGDRRGWETDRYAILRELGYVESLFSGYWEGEGK